MNDIDHRGLRISKNHNGFYCGVSDTAYIRRSGEVGHGIGIACDDHGYFDTIEDCKTAIGKFLSGHAHFDERLYSLIKLEQQNAKLVEYGEQLVLDLESVRNNRKYAVKEYKNVKQKNENLIEFMKSLLTFGSTGEDAEAIKREIEQVIQEAKA